MSRPPTRRYRTVIADNARWDDFEFRDDDIVISTPAKSGTTWMQMICAVLVLQTTELPAPLTELSPWLDVQTERLDDVAAKLAAQRHRRFIKTHTPLDGVPFDDRVTYVCVGRDPRDVAVSWDNHFENMDLGVVIASRAKAVGLDDLAELMPDGIPERPAELVDRFRAWLEDDAPVEQTLTSLKGVLHHLETFWDVRERPNVALFHYADLSADLDGEMRRLADALGIAVDESRWPDLVHAATFDQMRSRAGELAPQVTLGFWNDVDRFFHRGASGQWQSLVDDELAARYDDRVRTLTTPDLARWAHDGRATSVAPS
jgi:hypothetical protein